MPRPRTREPPPSKAPEPPSIEGIELPVVGERASSAFLALPTVRATPSSIPPKRIGRGLVIFDLDGTILDDLSLISHVASDVMHHSFGTDPEEARIHYLATTGMPFEAQLAQLYPDAPAALRAAAARTFHQRKISEAYAHAGPFPEVPKLFKQLDRDGWTMVVSTGAETEMADLMLEREGLRYWFEEVLGSRDGTKREHLAEYRRRYPGVPIFLVGDSRFDMEAARSLPGIVPIGRASSLHGWALSAEDLRAWGAAWADASLNGLPAALARLERAGSRPVRRRPKRRTAPAPRRTRR